MDDIDKLLDEADKMTESTVVEVKKPPSELSDQITRCVPSTNRLLNADLGEEGQDADEAGELQTAEQAGIEMRSKVELSRAESQKFYIQKIFFFNCLFSV